MAIDAVVFDLDGVIRHFEHDHRVAVERRHGLAPGTLWEHAWSDDIHPLAITGRLPMADWADEVGRRAGSVAAAREWIAHRGTIDTDVMMVVDAVRSSGRPVVILTNGTDTVTADLEAHDVLHRFDRVFNSWDLGIRKPDPEIFGHVCEVLDVGCDAVFFTDDRDDNVAGAAAAGLVARRFESAAATRRVLVELGVLAR